MKITEALNKVRNQFGIPWWIWSAFIVYAIFSSSSTPSETFSSKLSQLVAALVIFVLLPWFIRKKARQRKITKTIKKSEAESASQTMTKSEKQLGIFLKVYRYALTVVVLYAFFIFYKSWLPGLNKSLEGVSQDQITNAMWNHTVDVFRTSSVSKYWIAILAASLIFRAIQLTLWIKKRNSKQAA